MAQMLNSNSTMRKLELEGNGLGPKSAAEFGRMLSANKGLKHLNLESNQLTLGGQEHWASTNLSNFSTPITHYCPLTWQIMSLMKNVGKCLQRDSRITSH